MLTTCLKRIIQQGIDMTSNAILAVDPASCTGWVLFNIVDGEANILEYGAIEVDKTAESEGRRMISLRTQLEQVLNKLPQNPKHAHIESFFFNKRTCNGSEINVILRAAVYQLLAERRVPYTLHPPTHWKKFIGGSAVPRKTDIVKFGKAKASKAYIVEALAEKYGIHFPSHTRIDGRRLTFKTDISDAVGIGIYGMVCQTPNLRIMSHDSRDPVLNLPTSSTTSADSAHTH